MRKEKRNTQNSPPVMPSSLCSLPSLPNHKTAFTVVQNVRHAHRQQHPAKRPPSQGTAYSRHTPAHEQPASTALMCTTGVIRSSATCFRGSQAACNKHWHSSVSACQSTSTHQCADYLIRVANFLLPGTGQQEIHLLCSKPRADSKGGAPPAHLQVPIN